MHPLLKPLRRYRWLDTIITRFESYGSLLEQYGLRPSLRTIFELVVAAVLGLSAILTQSWVPVGVAIAVVVFASLRGTRVRTAEAPTLIAPSQSDSIREASGVPTLTLEQLSATVEEYTRNTFEGARANMERAEILRTELAEISERLRRIEKTIRPKARGLLDAPPALNIESRFDQLEAEIQAARDYAKGSADGLSHSIGQLRQMIELSGRRLQDYFGILVTAIRVRDAEKMLDERDAIVMDLGEKLLTADPNVYPDDTAWGDTYTRWKLALEQIDDIVVKWAPTRTRCLDIRAADYETNTAAPPPQSNLTGDRALFRYKTLAQARKNYVEQREAMFQFFYSKAGELPG